jgi:purine-cytosine permease-like protein
MGSIGPGFISIVGAVIGLAVVAVLVSQKAQTSQVFQGAGTALSAVIGAAVSPVSGNTNNMIGSSGSGIGGAAG